MCVEAGKSTLSFQKQSERHMGQMEDMGFYIFRSVNSWAFSAGFVQILYLHVVPVLSSVYTTSIPFLSLVTPWTHGVHFTQAFPLQTHR